MVQACDSGTPMQCAMTSVRINVADFNDESPTFDQDTYRTDVCLNTASTGTDLVQPVASDRDSGSNAELLYTLVPPTQSLFSINPTNGRISIAQEPNITSRHSMTVMARDMGDNSLSSTAQVIIQIVNCSARDLFFREPFQYYEIIEGQTSFVGRVSTLMLDLSTTPEDVTFTPNPPTNPFTNTLNVCMMRAHALLCEAVSAPACCIDACTHTVFHYILHTHTLRIILIPQILELKAEDDILDELREENGGLDREARSLYTVVVRARDSTQQESYTSVSIGTWEKYIVSLPCT